MRRRPESVADRSRRAARDPIDIADAEPPANAVDSNDISYSANSSQVAPIPFISY